MTILRWCNLFGFFATAAATSLSSTQSGEASQRLTTLIVGGGPNLEHNQVAIESNIRYVDRILPVRSPRRILYADGNRESKNVLFSDSAGKDAYRATLLKEIDGPAKNGAVRSELSDLAASLSRVQKQPVLVYLTGHGSPDNSPDNSNNRFDLWGDEELTVKQLATLVQALPKADPVAVVMVECFSGSFANLIFEGGDSNANVSDHSICGFFASVAQRMAAGCTPNVNEADYHDFTGYFFAALTGQDRLGRKVVGADYNHDSKVGMNEAFAYSLIHDDSIDTPVCTSDAFLRRFVKTPESQVFQESYADVLKWATPSQKAALEALSGQLKLSTDDRIGIAYRNFRHTTSDSDVDADVRTIRFVRLAKSVVLAHKLSLTGAREIKERFSGLLKLEAANPFE